MGVSHVAGERREVEGLVMVKSALASGEGEKRLNQALLLLAGGEHFFAGAAKLLCGGVGVA